MSRVDFPIDLVYMWVDGNDAEWQAKRAHYSGECLDRSRGADAISVARWRNNDELRYSLRSVEMYAPWVNHIYIITDNQRPEWLANHPKVSVVDHREILPPEALPTFNSEAIESCLYKIKGLCEHFIVANDDTLFAQKVEPTDFFLSDGRPIVRLSRFNRKKALRRGLYHRTVRRMQDLVQEHMGVLVPLAPHHNFDALRKSDYAHCVENICAEQWRYTTLQRFRDDKDMQRCFVSYYMVVSCGAEMRKVGRYNRIRGIVGRIRAFITNSFACDSRVISANLPDYEKVMRKYNPLMICANDNELSTDADCARLRAFLQHRYPRKSKFEI